MRVTDVRDVPFGEWSSTVLALREEGYAYFDWLTAVDETDREGDAAGLRRRVPPARHPRARAR